MDKVIARVREMLEIKAKITWDENWGYWELLCGGLKVNKALSDPQKFCHLMVCLIGEAANFVFFVRVREQELPNSSQ